MVGRKNSTACLFTSRAAKHITLLWFPKRHLVNPNWIGDGLFHLRPAKWAYLRTLAEGAATYGAAIGVLPPDMLFPIPFSGLLDCKTRFLFLRKKAHLSDLLPELLAFSLG